LYMANLKKFIEEVRVEMKKVSWPTRDQLKESTNVVIGVSLVITIIVFVMDKIVSSLIGLIF
jgi:preprotein translocase subunit SecE